MSVCHFKSICTYVLWSKENYKLIDNELEFTGYLEPVIKYLIMLQLNPINEIFFISFLYSEIETKWLTIARN